MAAAYAAKRAGANDVLVVERAEGLGGILPQCIHTGFGLFEFGSELTGPEYAYRWIKKAQDEGVSFLTKTAVIRIQEKEIPSCVKNPEYEVTVSGISTGIKNIKCKSVIIATGCRERPRGAIKIPGTRCAGIYTAGCAQRLVNIEGLMPGEKIVILGSGDIGLIMARRMTLEGAKVQMVIERLDRPGGLQRNVVQCLDDFDIPLLLSSTILEIYGEKRVEGVKVGSFDSEGNIIPDSIKFIDCDTVLLSVGLIPENEVLETVGVKLDKGTNGPLTDDYMQTGKKGIFACGNSFRVYDLVDDVSDDAKVVGEYAAAYVRGDLSEMKSFSEKKKGEKTRDKNLYEIGDDSRRIVCTICPKGCILSVTEKSDGEYDIKGYECKRGLKYAHDEIISPARILTTSVLCFDKNGKKREMSVKSNKPIELKKLARAADAVRKLRIEREVLPGQVIIKNVEGTDADIVATGF